MTDQITASGGKGTATATNGDGSSLTITAVKDGPSCNYKAYWNDGTQLGSANTFPCNQGGWDAFLDMVRETKKAGAEWVKALRGVKFWQ